MQGLQGCLWPVHFKPLAGEILSSWISRIAGGYGLTLTQFVAMQMPKTLGIGFDLDQVTDRGFLQSLVAGTGTADDDVVNTTFIPEDGLIYCDPIPLHLEWIVPLALNSRHKQRSGLPFCPSCLATDAVPYYRKHWRYGFMPVCPVHGVLETQCPACGHPYAYQGYDHGRQTCLGSGALSTCRGCGVRIERVEQTTGDAAAFVAEKQARIFEAMRERWIMVPNRGNVHIYPYLWGLRCLASIVQRSAGRKIALWFEREHEIHLPWDSPLPALALEKQPPKVRTCGLFIAHWLIDGWPERLVHLMDSLNLRLSDLLTKEKEWPFWLSDPAIEQPFKVSDPISHQQLMMAKQMLSRRLCWPVSAVETLEFCRNQKLPERVGERRLPTPESRQKVKDAWAAQNAAYERKKLNTSHLRTSDRSLYQVVREKKSKSSTVNSSDEEPLALDGLWRLQRDIDTEH